MFAAAAGIAAGLVVATGVGVSQTPTGPVLSLTATTENVSGAGEALRINILRWSTDAERDQLWGAWNLTAAPPAPAAAGGDNAAAGRGGRGGRGGRAGDATPAPKPTPEASLKAALDRMPTVGYVWSSEVTGYALRYAVRLPQPDGGERVLLITDRRLGAWNDAWKPAGSAASTNYEFSVIELHLKAKGDGEGKASLTGKVAADSSSKTLGLENYNDLPVVFKNVKRNKA